MTTCSSDTPIFNIRSGTLNCIIKRCNKWQNFNSQTFAQQKFNRKRDFS